jgi:hypothetical protein
MTKMNQEHYLVLTFKYKEAFNNSLLKASLFDTSF